MPSVTISNVASELIPRSRLRKSLVIQNEDSTISAFLKNERAATPTVSTTDHDIRLGPGASISFNESLDGNEPIQGRWTIIAASGTPRVSFFETEDVIR